MTDDPPEESSKGGALGDSLRKALITGISAVFMTEEGIRSSLSDMRLPKEAITYLLQQTAGSRRELVRIVGDELKSFLHGADVVGTLRKALSGMKIEVKAEIRLVDEHAESTSSKAGDKVGDKTTDKAEEPPSASRRRGHPERA
jgi:hypothetical protein